VISILDYGAGNLRSVQNTLAELGAEFELVHDSEGLRRASKIILPGVGAFDQAMNELDGSGMRQALDVTRDILGQDLLNAAFWIDIRNLENSDRSFGPGPTAVWNNFRKMVPFREVLTQPSFVPRDDIAVHFLRANSPANFYSANAISMPVGCACH